jgi:hypothetical protein
MSANKLAGGEDERPTLLNHRDFFQHLSGYPKDYPSDVPFDFDVEFELTGIRTGVNSRRRQC